MIDLNEQSSRYIPNPEGVANLEAYGNSGGWSGEELTAAAVRQSAMGLLTPSNGLLAVVANLPNVRTTSLYCTVLYCTVLYCTVLYCTVHTAGRRAASFFFVLRHACMHAALYYHIRKSTHGKSWLRLLVCVCVNY
eukprot:COSAG06_NODE_1296_length_9960_cov_2.570009_8_plen_136_part_00